MTTPTKCIDCAVETQEKFLCSACRTKREDAYKRIKSRNRNGKYNHGDWIQFRYDISSDDYEEMLDQQNDVCAICKRAPDEYRLHVDHKHTPEEGGTGWWRNYQRGRFTPHFSAVRGLLCEGCNFMLHQFNDNAKRFRAAAEYLERYEADGSPVAGIRRRRLKEIT